VVGEGRWLIGRTRDLEGTLESLATTVPTPRIPKRGKQHATGTTKAQRDAFGAAVLEAMMENGGMPISEEQTRKIARDLDIDFDAMTAGK
jgi:hypothetical protein